MLLKSIKSVSVIKHRSVQSPRRIVSAVLLTRHQWPFIFYYYDMSTVDCLFSQPSVTYDVDVRRQRRDLVLAGCRGRT